MNRRTSGRRKARERLQKARIRTEMGADVADNSIVVNIPDETPAGMTAWTVVTDVLRYACVAASAALALIGAVSLVLPQTREVLYAIWRSSVSEMAGFLGL